MVLLVAPRPRGVGVRGVGGGVGCPPRGDAAARCHFNHNPLVEEHKGLLPWCCQNYCRVCGAFVGGFCRARTSAGSAGATENYIGAEPRRISVLWVGASPTPPPTAKAAGSRRRALCYSLISAVWE